jgi:phenylacetate-CoA ligase
MSLWQTIRFSVSALRLARIPTWAPEHVARLRTRRLRRLVRIAVSRSPFYRNKYRQVDLDQCDLVELPITKKQELMARFDDTVTDAKVRRADVERFLEDSGNLGRYYLGRYAVSQTSGS